MSWVTVDGEKDDKEISVYSLSYCHACDEAKAYLKERDVKFRYLDIDKADPEHRQDAAGIFGWDIPQGGISIAFPIIVVDDTKIIGFDREKIANSLNLTQEKKVEKQG